MSAPSILIVDDNAELRDLLRDALTRMDYVATTAANGEEAFRAISQNRFDVVITDMLMPEKDGIEVMGELRRLQPDARIVAMSGGGRGSRDHYLQTAKGLGAHAVLGKPFSMSELTAALNAVMAKS